MSCKNGKNDTLPVLDFEMATLIEGIRVYERDAKLTHDIGTHHEVCTSEGDLIFHNVHDSAIAIYSVYNRRDLRRRGLFRSIIEYLISRLEYDQIVVVSVEASLLVHILNTSTFGGKRFIQYWLRLHLDKIKMISVTFDGRPSSKWSIRGVRRMIVTANVTGQIGVEEKNSKWLITRTVENTPFDVKCGLTTMVRKDVRYAKST